MTQATSPQPIAPLTYTGGIIHWAGEALSTPLITKIIKAAAVPLSIIAAYIVQPYLILDPTTNLLGIGCAVLINTLAFKYFHAMIQDWWERHWITNYPVPERPVEQNCPASPLERQQLDSPAEVLYKAAVQALDAAIHQVKMATKKRDSVDQGQESKVNDLHSVYVDKKTDLINCAKNKKTLIESLIHYSKELESYKKTADTLNKALEKAEASTELDVEKETAKNILAINVLETAEEIQRAFNETFDSLSRFEERYGVRYSIRTEVDTFTTNLEAYRSRLKTLEETLKNNRKILETLRKRENEKEALKSDLLNKADHIDPLSAANRSPEKKSQLETARLKRDTAKESLEAKMNERLKFLEDIAKQKHYGIRNPEEHGPVDDFLQFASLDELMRWEKELLRQPANDETAIGLNLENLNRDLLPFQASIERSVKDQIALLKGWGDKFSKASAKVNDRLASLDKTMVRQAFDKLVLAQAALTPEQKEVYRNGYSELRAVLNDLERSSRILTQKNSSIEGIKSPPGFPKLFQTETWSKLLTAHRLRVPDDGREIHPHTNKRILNLFLGNLLNLTPDEIQAVVNEYHTMASRLIQQKNAQIHDLEEVASGISKLKQRKIDLADLSGLIQKNESLIRSFEINPEPAMAKIRGALQAIFELKEKRDKDDELLKRIPPLIKLREAEVKRLTEELEKFEDRSIRPLEEEVSRASDAYIALEIKRNDLLSRARGLEEELKGLESNIERVSKTVAANESEESELKKRIELLDAAVKLTPAMKPVLEILHLESDGASGPEAVLKACDEAHAAWKEAEKARPLQISACASELNRALEEKRIKAEEKEAALSALLKERGQQFIDKINTLRVEKHAAVISASEAVRTFYDAKIERQRSGIALIQDNDQSEIDNKRIQVLEKKIHLAAQRLEFDSDKANHRRLHLAEHRLLRLRAEKKWKTSHGGARENVRTELIEAIKAQQDLVFRYYASKLDRDRNSLNKRTLKANFAILNLVLDRIYIEISPLTPAERKAYNIIKKIGEYLDQAAGIDKTVGKAAKLFNLAAYGNLIPEAPKPWWIRRLPFIRPHDPKEIPVNLFIKKLKEQLNIDSHNTDKIPNSALPKLTNFLEAINTESKDLHTNKSTLGYEEKTPSARLVGCKINLIQESLRKPFVNDADFTGQYTTHYLPARRTYKTNKYLEKRTYAEIMEHSTKATPLYKESEARRLQAIEDRRREGEAAIAGAAERTAALHRREQAMAQGAGIEKASYLIPSLALWILYGLTTPLCPILSCISLSMRVGQNILGIGSAAHLFVQGMFARLNPNSNPSRPLTPERVAAA